MLSNRDSPPASLEALRHREKRLREFDDVCAKNEYPKAYGLSLANIIEFTQWLSVEGRMFLVTALVAISVHSHSKSFGNLLRNAGDKHVLHHMRSVRHAGANSRNLLLHSPCLRASVVNSSPLGTTIYHMLCSLESISHPHFLLLAAAAISD